MNAGTLCGILEEKDRVRYADFIVPLRTGQASIHHLSEHGLVIAQAYSAAAVCFPKGNAAELARHLPRGKRSLSIHGSKLRAAVEAQTGESLSLITAQYVYVKSEVDLSVPSSCSFRVLTVKDKDLVTEHYHLVNESIITSYLRNGQITGLEAGGRLVGFIGVHYGGSMGILEVFPGQRRHGFGELLERYLISSQISKGLIPYCHIVDGNVRSMLLQKKLGLIADSLPVYWN